MTTPIIRLVTRTNPATPGTAKKYNDTGNSEANVSAPLNFGSLNIDANTWSAVRVLWGHITDMGGNTAVNEMKVYVNGDFGGHATITHYDKITATWEAPGGAGTRETGNTASIKTYTGAKPVLKDDGVTGALTAIDQFTQFIFCQLYVETGTPTGSHSTAEGQGRLKLAFNFS